MEREVDGFLDLADHCFGRLLRHDVPVQGDDDQRQLPVIGQELAFDDFVLAQVGDHLIIGCAFRQIVRHDGGHVAGLVRLAARGYHRDKPIDAIGELQLRCHRAEGVNLLFLQQILALDHGKHVILARREPPVDFLVLVKFLGVGSEQFRQAIVDPELVDAHSGETGEHHDQNADRDWVRESEKANAFKTKRKQRLRLAGRVFCVHLALDLPRYRASPRGRNRLFGSHGRIGGSTRARCVYFGV